MGPRHPIPRPRAVAVLVCSLACLGPLAAEAPLAVATAKVARARLIADAELHLGAPYRYGGSDQGGFDCSGLVYRVYQEALGLSTPRTVATLHAFAEPLDRAELQPGDLIFFDTTGPLAHVGIYAGDGRFIHAASEGPRTGVLYSSLAEAYWARSYAGSGRLIPPADYLGLILTAALGPSFGAAPFLRGFSAEAGLAHRLWGSLELGLAARPEYDAALGVGRLPLVLVLGLDRELRFFLGPAFTIGQPSLETDLAARAYEPAGGLLATAGVSWSPWRFRAAGVEWALTGELVYNRYIAEDGEAADFLADQRARIRANLLLRARWGI